MKKYYSPFVFFLSAQISMTVSQLGKLGFDEDHAQEFAVWWGEHKAMVQELNPGFDFGSWPEGFDPNNSDTWELLFLP